MKNTVETAKGVLLFTVICTLFNGILHLAGSAYHFFYAVKLPDFAAEWGVKVYLSALLLSLVLYGGTWVLASKRDFYLLVGALLLGADFCLCGYTFAANGLSVLPVCDLVLHALFIVLLVRGYIAAKKLQEQEKIEKTTEEMLKSMMDGKMDE